MKIFLILLTVLVCGCSHVIEKPVPIPVEVAVPVSASCVTGIPEELQWETSLLVPEDSLCTKVDALLIERVQRMSYIDRLKASLKGCIAK